MQVIIREALSPRQQEIFDAHVQLDAEQMSYESLDRVIR